MSGSGYLHWSNDPFEKIVIFPPDPLFGGFSIWRLLPGPHLSQECRGQAVAHVAWCAHILADFARLIVSRPHSNNGVEVMSFLKEERGTLSRKC
jgi:hypothetical protein